MVLGTYPHDLVTSTLNRDSVDVTSPFIRVIINKAANFFLSAPLIGQLGKNFANGYDNLIPGDVLLKLATDKVRAIQAVLGGKFVYLECEDKDALLNFYGDNGFVIFGKRDLDRDERDRQSGQYLVQLLKYLGD